MAQVNERFVGKHVKACRYNAHAQKNIALAKAQFTVSLHIQSLLEVRALCEIQMRYAGLGDSCYAAGHSLSP